MRRWTGNDVRIFRNDVLDESRVDFARRVGCSVRSIERWEAGDPVGRQLSRVLGEVLLQAPEQVRAEFEALRGRPDRVETAGDGESAQTAEAGGSTNRREIFKLAGASAVAPVIVSDALAEAADEVMEFTRRAEASSVGPGVLEQLELAVIGLNQAYLHTRPEQLLGVVRWYRRQVDQVIQHPHTLRQGRELYTYAGWLSELLARLVRDLGALTTAEAYCIDAWEHGWQAEDDELCAWAMKEKASNALFANRPQAALSAALEGAAHTSSGQAIAMGLVGEAVRAYARLGRREDFESALREAMDLREHLPTQRPTRFGQDLSPERASILHSIDGYAASSCIWLGLAKGAQRHAAHTLQLIDAAPAEHRSRSRKAIARIDLGLARTALGSPDEACHLGDQALRWGPPAGHPVLARALELDGLLQRRYPDLPEVTAFHERCHLLAGARLSPD